ncbi:hypothetical protein JXA12_02885 [Candidatus Woesearchaeota archaeon]|nr:hypothetical protein [Candidatus Woesearchaeota archaeon]
MHKKTIHVVLVVLGLFSILSLSANMQTYRDATGEAMYFREDGGIGMTEPGAPLPEEIASMNVLLWATIALVVVAGLVYLGVHERIVVERKAKRH